MKHGPSHHFPAHRSLTFSAVYAEKGDFIAAAGEAAGKLYGYGKTDVLFKPTKVRYK